MGWWLGAGGTRVVRVWRYGPEGVGSVGEQ